MSAFASPSLDWLLRMAAESAQRGSALHGQFLQMRRESLENVRALIEMQIHSNMAGGGAQAASPSMLQASPALFDSCQLDEFGTGRISACLGPAFARYDLRRIPRIPNGDLKMMSRVTAISGCPGDFDSPASVTVEYDVPPDAWYFRDSAYPSIPGSLWMEIALQPCGFLSAYLDTYALVPYEPSYFRNLDGSLRALETPQGLFDVRGKTIVTRAVLLSHAVSGGSVIQKYAFEISCDGRPIYAGESIFGYFSVEAMANQVGLDGGRAAPPAFRSDESLARRLLSIELARLQAARHGRPNYHLPRGRLHFLDEIRISPDGGRYGKGYIYASRPVNPRDWFYPYHFYQDPVMPGSLGVEAILEAMQGFALAGDFGCGLRSPHLRVTIGAAPLTWRYRGQITQQHRLMELEVHLGSVTQQGSEIILLGDANLWVDGLRIYELKNAAIGIVEG